MWDSVSNIAAIVVIVLILQLLGLPDWIDKLVRKRQSDSHLAAKITELENRITDLEKKIK